MFVLWYFCPRTNTPLGECPYYSRSSLILIFLIGNFIGDEGALIISELIEKTTTIESLNFSGMNTITLNEFIYLFIYLKKKIALVHMVQMKLEGHWVEISRSKNSNFVIWQTLIKLNNYYLFYTQQNKWLQIDIFEVIGKQWNTYRARSQWYKRGSYS